MSDCVRVCVSALRSFCYKSPEIPHAPTPYPLLSGHSVTYSFVLNSPLKVARLKYPIVNTEATLSDAAAYTYIW
jgi:hypothetical protein